MATLDSIRDAANTVRDNKNAVYQKNNKYDGSASTVSFAWKGDVGEAFKDASKRVRTQMTAIINEYGNLSSKLTNLSNSVKRAEAEEEAMRKAATKK